MFILLSIVFFIIYFLKKYTMLQQTDPILADMIARESGRQDTEIELIASENYVSKDVLEANGSILTNKYSECSGTQSYYKNIIYYFKDFLRCANLLDTH